MFTISYMIKPKYGKGLCYSYNSHQNLRNRALFPSFFYTLVFTFNPAYALISWYIYEFFYYVYALPLFALIVFVSIDEKCQVSLRPNCLEIMYAVNLSEGALC